MSVEEAPRTIREQIDEALARHQASARREAIDLPEMLGEYRAVKGRPGWYLRPMKLRQQIRVSAMTAEVQQGDTTSALYGHATIGALVLYRVAQPEPNDLQAWLERVMSGEAFCQAQVDEVLDEFSLDELNLEVLRPMGFGWEPEGSEGDQGNVLAESTGQSA